MDKKVYHGEYTLKYWIDLLLKQNIELPPYQRSFVWTEEQVKEFISSIKDNVFIPPVTIGVCNIEGRKHNYILDGQQRLSSILLSYFGVYPKKEVFPSDLGVLTMTDITSEEDIEDSTHTHAEYIDWSLKKLAENGPTEQGVNKAITDLQYNYVNYNISQDFFENNYLSFSFIIPMDMNEEESEQHQFYSTVFRNINILGVPLSPMESRQSLYFLKPKFNNFFVPNCCKNLRIKLVGKEQKYDFVRTISILSQYKKEGRCEKLAQSYKSKMEKYYEEYIYAVVNDKSDGMFIQFSSIIPDNNFEDRINILGTTLQKLEYANLNFTSIIDADVYMFGLVYNTVIEGRFVDFARKDDLMRTLHQQVIDFKQDESHKSAPSLLKHLRKRVEQSVTIFNQYAITSSTR